ncbi:hypothetical protein [Salibacterium halotolerans]|uniref:Type IV pilus assembly protein PilO n=1 Tax=Salibacterium halotolerans TaxID=1884432 RepID=A0A1I5STH8_9BACI|nr:hypothetical protein [Salibacterium halotolerans]SFP74045.1 hypothetical protein SAMN05518683_10988 [Salibacterium halotolerans]
MRIDMEKRHWITAGCALLLLIIFAVFQNNNGLGPLTAEQERLQENIQAAETQLENQSSGADAGEYEEAALFRSLQQLPLNPRPEEFLLVLDQAEERSGSYIMSLEQLEPGSAPVDETESEQEQNTQEQETGGSTEQPETENNSVVEEEQDQKKEQGASAMYEETDTDVFTYHVRVRTPEYANLVQFVEAVDAGSRVLNIHSISFQGREEIVREDQERQPFVIDLTVTAFYYAGNAQGLEDLPPSSTLEEPDGNDIPIR